MPLTLFSDPFQAYASIAASLTPGEKYVQPDFDYEGRPTRRVEDIYPNYSLFDPDGSNSWELGQGQFSDCMALSQLVCIAEAKNKYQIEDLIFPNTVSNIGLYLISIGVGVERKWFPIDSQVPVYPETSYWKGTPVGVTPVKGNPVLWGILIEKAAATIKGNSYKGITAQYFDEPNSDFLPYVIRTANNHAEVIECINAGGYSIFSYSQQYDATGAPITPPGIVYNHAHGLIDAFEHQGVKGVRISNPWGGGSDYVSSILGEDSQFWLQNPELADKVLATTGRHGEYWIEWEELALLRNGSKSYRFFIPLPWSDYPNAYYFEHTLNDLTVPSTDFPNLTQLRSIAAKNAQNYRIQVNQPTNIYIGYKWKQGSTGSRHSFVNIAKQGANSSALPINYAWWYRPNSTKGVLQSGIYELFPSCVSPLDRGTLEIRILTDKPIVLL